MDEKELQTIIIQQQEEIKNLKEQVDRLISQMTNQVGPDLKAYYSKQYLEKTTEIIKNRLMLEEQEIDQLIELEKAFNEEEEKNRLEKMVLENLKDELFSIDNKLQQHYLKHEETRFEMNNKLNRLEKKQVDILEKIKFKWHKLNCLIQDCKNQTIGYEVVIEEIMIRKNDIIQNNGGESMELYQVEKEISNLQQVTNKELEQLTKDINNLKMAKEKLEVKINTHQITPVSKRLQDIVSQLNQKKENKTILEELFQTTLTNHQKQIDDEYLRLKLQELPLQEISKTLEMLIASFIDELNSVETDVDKRTRKINQLNQLKEEVWVLNNIQTDKEKKEIEYNHLKGLYISIQKNVQEIEEYIAKTNNVINQNKRYEHFYQSYINYHEKIVKLNNDLKESINHLKKLQDRRRIIVHDPFSKESLSSIDEKIKASLATYQRLEQEITDTTENFNNLTNHEEYKKLLDIILEKEKYEERLPYFYEQMQELKNLIDDHHHTLLKYKEDLKPYDDMVLKIKVLTDEIND